jgi:hypothetical protein
VVLCWGGLFWRYITGHHQTTAPLHHFTTSPLSHRATRPLDHSWAIQWYHMTIENNIKNSKAHHPQIPRDTD